MKEPLNKKNKTNNNNNNKKKLKKERKKERKSEKKKDKRKKGRKPERQERNKKSEIIPITIRAHYLLVGITLNQHDTGTECIVKMFRYYALLLWGKFVCCCEFKQLLDQQNFRVILSQTKTLQFMFQNPHWGHLKQ